MDIHYFIGIKIKTRRKELGLSGADLAKKLNISQQQVSRYENGINKIPLNHLVSIAIALKCPRLVLSRMYYWRGLLYARWNN
ncbi:helix-turn-helix transcriptional regulator [Providencia stuartii]|nr:helix-turn-helix transcriptional regulator [Providencia stuartii]